MAKKRFPLFGNPRQFADVETEATKGAMVGRDLYGPDGKLLTADQILNPAAAGNQNQKTIWRFIQEIPANIKAIASLSGKGLAARKTDGDWTLRTLQQGSGVAVSNGDGEGGNPSVALNNASIASLLLADGAVQEVRQGAGVAIDSTDPKRPIVSVANGGLGDELYPQMTDQAGDPLTDQAGNPIRQNTPAIPYSWLSGEGTGYLQRDAAGVWALVAEPVKPVYALTALPPATPYPREIYVSGTSGVSGIIPAYSDGVNWLRFSDNTEVN